MYKHSYMRFELNVKIPRIYVQMYVGGRVVM